jgi:hypothetical protein
MDKQHNGVLASGEHKWSGSPLTYNQDSHTYHTLLFLCIKKHEHLYLLLLRWQAELLELQGTDQTY